jgi:hypothetical protein
MIMTTGNLHVVSVGSVLMLLPVSAPLINLSLVRNSQGWSSPRRPLLWTGALPAVGLVMFWVTGAIVVPTDGHYGPGVNIGSPNRLLLLVYPVWLVTVARKTIKLRGQRIQSPEATTPDRDRKTGHATQGARGATR